ncbi:MAG: FAD:protein FMN transferase [Clostridiales bacterium]|jgi:thiamine biosynthesis lipoprotein|nr:FAD:protein FMN transferase [Clostridiales bacterium]
MFKLIKKLNLVLAIFIAFSPLLSCSQPKDEYLRSNTVVFGGGIIMSIWALGEGENAQADAQSAVDDMIAMGEQVNSSIRVDQDSYLRRFNDSAVNEVIEIDRHIYDMMSAVLEYWDKVDGYFDPSVVRLANFWNVGIEGISKYGYPNFDPIDRQPDYLPTPDEIKLYQSDLPLPKALDLQYDKENEKFYMTKKQLMELDLGGIAKGYLADLGGEIAKSHNLKSAMFNLSGDIYVYGQYYFNKESRLFNIGITDPRPRRNLMQRGTLAATAISNTGLVTSGDYERFYEYYYDDQHQNSEQALLVHHIINPKTGAPSGLIWDSSLQAGQGAWKNDSLAVSSATVIHPKAMIAEILSTAIMAAGIEEGLKFVQQIDGASCLIFADYASLSKEGAVFAYTDDFEFFNQQTYNEFNRYIKV